MPSYVTLILCSRHSWLGMQNGRKSFLDRNWSINGGIFNNTIYQMLFLRKSLNLRMANHVQNILWECTIDSQPGINALFETVRKDIRIHMSKEEEET